MCLINYLHYDRLSKQTILIGLESRSYQGKPLDLLERWANSLGCGVRGSYCAFKRQLSIKQKIPVLIDPFRQIYFFPTLSPTNLECYWINASQIKSIKSKGLESEIMFKDQRSLVLGIGRRSLKKQWMRCQTMELMIHHSRMNEASFFSEINA